MIVKDDYLIYDKYSLEDYLLSLGFDKFDINSMRKMLCEDVIAEYEIYKDQVDEYELMADHWYCHAHSLAEAMEDIADKLESGKGTKVKLAQDIRNNISYYLD